MPTYAVFINSCAQLLNPTVVVLLYMLNHILWQNEDKFFEDYAMAHMRLSELG
jgi:type IV secretory pathway VirB3-like protein